MGYIVAMQAADACGEHTMFENDPDATAMHAAIDAREETDECCFCDGTGEREWLGELQECDPCDGTGFAENDPRQA